jgi:hypothetical protein
MNRFVPRAGLSGFRELVDSSFDISWPIQLRQRFTRNLCGSICTPVTDDQDFGRLNTTENGLLMDLIDQITAASGLVFGDDADGDIHIRPRLNPTRLTLYCQRLQNMRRHCNGSLLNLARRRA